MWGNVFLTTAISFLCNSCGELTYNLEKTVESIQKQVNAICVILGIDPTPLEEPTNPDA